MPARFHRLHRACPYPDRYPENAPAPPRGCSPRLTSRQGSAPACRHFHRCGSSYQSTASSPLKYRFCLSRANQMPAPSPKAQESNPDRRKRRSPPFSPPYARNVFSVPAPESIESAHSALFSRFHPTGQTASGQTCASALFLLFPRQNQSVHRFLCFRAQMCSFCAARGRFYEYPAPKKSSRFQSVQPPPAHFRSLQSYDARKKRDPG